MKKELKPLPIDKKTSDAMWQFFYKTSIPRILEKKRMKEMEQNDNQ